MPVYRGSHRKEDGNLVGAFGEVVFEIWLNDNGIPYTRRDTTSHDYEIGDGLLVEVKTKDRSVRPKPWHDATLPKYNADHQKADWYAFLSLQRNKETGKYLRAFIVGVSPADEYHRLAYIKKKGVPDPSNKVSFWTDGLNLPISELRRPAELLTALRAA